VEAVIRDLPLEQLKQRVHILERNFFASVKRKAKLNSTLTSLQSEVKGALGSLNITLVNFAERLAASNRSSGRQETVLMPPK
jgi:hypothetical protein